MSKIKRLGQFGVDLGAETTDGPVGAMFSGAVTIWAPTTHYQGARGEYVELFTRERVWLSSWPGPTSFVTDDISVSRRGALTGLHGDQKTWKLVTCLHGAFYLVVACNDSESPEHKSWQAIVLSAANRLQVLIPPKFGNGHLSLEDGTIFHYKQSEYYDRAGQFTILWDDPDWNIFWPMEPLIVSARDRGLE